MSYRQIFYQIVFGTKDRERTITEEHCEELYKYIWGVIKIREKDRIINYVKNQKEHHKSERFYDEYKRILIENEITFEEKYLCNTPYSTRVGVECINSLSPRVALGAT